MTTDPSVSTDQPTTEAPAGRYLNDDRSTVILLKHPFAIGDVEYRAVTVRRITSREAKAYGLAVGHFIKAVTSGQIGAVVEPLYPGIELPREGFAMLDDDDMSVIEDAADSFFPERLKPVMAGLNELLALGLMPEAGVAEPA